MNSQTTSSDANTPGAVIIVRVAVGSSNPCKVESVRRAFTEVFNAAAAARTTTTARREVQIVISTYNVSSGVSNQPLGDTETRRGAMNRAKAAYEAACSSLNNDSSMGNKPDFSVGLEGGLDGAMEIPPDDLWCMAWMAIYGSQSEVCIAAKAEDDTFTSSSNVDQMQWGFAKTAAFLLPPALCELLLNNDDMELGDADDIVFKRVNSKHGQGTVGKLTNGQIDRTEYYVHALKLALIPWIRPELYMTREDKQQSTVIVV